MAALADYRTLRDFPLFRDLTDSELKSINQQLHCKLFPPGSNVINFEMPGDVVYVIQEGTLKIKVDQSDGHEALIALLGRGEIVGELSVIDGDTRSADVVTQERSTLLWLDRQCFERLVAENPRVQRSLLRILTRRLRLATEQIQALNTLDVQGKVTRQVVVLADQYGVRAPDGVLIPMRVTQSDLAAMVGASRERVNLAFGNLRRRKLISTNRAMRITVPDLDRLRRELIVR